MCTTAFSDKTVLVIEDSPVVQHLIRASLAPLGPAVRQALDGESGAAAAFDDPPDLILLDIGLPLLNGWGVLARLRADARTTQIPVVVVTAHAQPHMADRADEQGADGFVTKPFRPQDLRRIVAEQLLCSSHALV